MFIGDAQRLYRVFSYRRPEYVGGPYQDLMFRGHVTYRQFIKIHNFKATIPLPLPSCNCVFVELDRALRAHSLEDRLLAIRRIGGIRLAIASAILHFSDPDRYAIIDDNVLQECGQWAGRLDSEPKSF